MIFLDLQLDLHLPGYHQKRMLTIGDRLGEVYDFQNDISITCEASKRYETPNFGEMHENAIKG